MPIKKPSFKLGDTVEVYDPLTDTKKLGEVKKIENDGPSPFYKIYSPDDGDPRGIRYMLKHAVSEDYLAKVGEVCQAEAFCHSLPRVNQEQKKEVILFLDPAITPQETKADPEFASFEKEARVLSPRILARQSLLLANGAFTDVKNRLLELRQDIEDMKDHPKYEMLGDDDLRRMYVYHVRVYNQLCDEVLSNLEVTNKQKNKLPDHINYLLDLISLDLLWQYGTAQSLGRLATLKKMNVDPKLYRDMAVDHRTITTPIGVTNATRWRTNDPYNKAWPTYLTGFTGMLLVGGAVLFVATLIPAFPVSLTIAVTALAGIAGGVAGSKLGPKLNAWLKPTSCRYYDECLKVSETILSKEQNQHLSSEEILAKLASCDRGINILAYSHFFGSGDWRSVKSTDMGADTHYGNRHLFFNPILSGPYKGKKPIDVLKASNNPAAKDVINALEAKHKSNIGHK